MSSNFLSHLSWREQCKALVDFVQKHRLVDDVAALRAHVEQNRLAQLLRATLAAEGVRVKLFDVASVAEVISFYRLVSLLSKHADVAAHELEFTQLLVDALTAPTHASAHAALKLRLLASLYSLNDASAGAQRYLFFVAMAEFAVRTQQAGAMASRVRHLDELLAAWRVSDLERVRRLYRAANRLLAAAGDGRAALAAQVQYLTTFGADQKGQADAVADAVDAARQVVVLPDVFVCRNVLALGAVQRLKGDKDAHRATLYALLELLVNGSLADLEALAARSAADLKALDIDVAAVRDKMRLLTVASVCAAAIDAAAVATATATATRSLVAPASVDLTELARTLGVGSDAGGDLLAEQWTMRAINAGLIRAKIDQLARRVTVSYALRRSVTAADWKVSQQQLGTWLRNIDAVVNNLANRPPAAAAAAAIDAPGK